MSTLLLYLAIVILKQENTCKVLNNKRKFPSLSLLMTGFSLAVTEVIWSLSTENQECLEFMASLTNDWLAQSVNIPFSLLLFGTSLGVLYTLFNAFLCGLSQSYSRWYFSGYCTCAHLGTFLIKHFHRILHLWSASGEISPNPRKADVIYLAGCWG